MVSFVFFVGWGTPHQRRVKLVPFAQLPVSKPFGRTKVRLTVTVRTRQPSWFDATTVTEVRLTVPVALSPGDGQKVGEISLVFS